MKTEIKVGELQEYNHNIHPTVDANVHEVFQQLVAQNDLLREGANIYRDQQMEMMKANIMMMQSYNDEPESMWWVWKLLILITVITWIYGATVFSFNPIISFPKVYEVVKQTDWESKFNSIKPYFTTENKTKEASDEEH